MSIVLDGTTGITTPGLTNTGTETLVNLTTTGNTILGDASTDTLNVGNGGLIKDASGNVGIGVTPSAWGSRKALEVGNAGSALFSVGANQNYLTSNSYFDGAFKYGATGTATAYQQYAGTHAWLNATSGSAGGVVTFTQAMTLNTNGVLALQGASTSANGVGITFPASQSASSDANTLDDYEEGTWTPSLSSSGASFTYPRGQYGSYCKIGSLVYAQFYIGPDVTGTTSNAVVLSNLPFASANLNALAQSSGAFWQTRSTIVGFTVNNNDTNVTIWKQGAGVAGAIASDVAGSNAYMVGMIVYRAST